jgi:dolichol-phosphate mannosyltransferase
MKRLDVVVPVFNEEACLPALIVRLDAVRASLVGRYDLHVIFVNDGSTDRSEELLHTACDQRPHVASIHFSRNFGHQIAVTAGLDHTTADVVAILDADLQDPPELIPAMLDRVEEGFDVVYGKRRSRRGESPFKLLTAKAFYVLIGVVTRVDIPTDTGDFWLVTRRVSVALQQMPERHRFIRGMVPWVGFRASPFLYDRDARFAGETKYPLRKMFHFALEAIFSFSRVPLVVSSVLGIGMMLFAAAGTAAIAYLHFVAGGQVPGVTLAILTSVMLGGMQLLMLGITAEYIGRIFEEVKRRPLYIVSHRENLDGGVLGAGQSRER